MTKYTGRHHNRKKTPLVGISAPSRRKDKDMTRWEDTSPERRKRAYLRASRQLLDRTNEELQMDLTPQQRSEVEGCRGVLRAGIDAAKEVGVRRNDHCGGCGAHVTGWHPFKEGNMQPICQQCWEKERASHGQ